MARNLALKDGKGVGITGVKPPDISNEAVKEGMLEPWDDSPWRDSKPEGHHEIDRGKDIQPTIAEQECELTTLQVICNLYGYESANLASDCVDMVSTGPRASGGILRPSYLALVRATDNNNNETVGPTGE